MPKPIQRIIYLLSKTFKLYWCNRNKGTTLFSGPSTAVSLECYNVSVDNGNAAAAAAVESNTNEKEVAHANCSCSTMDVHSHNIFCLKMAHIYLQHCVWTEAVCYVLCVYLFENAIILHSHCRNCNMYLQRFSRLFRTFNVFVCGNKM